MSPRTNDQHDGCALCRDEATRATILSVAGRDARVVDRLGRQFSVPLDLVPDAAIGDDVLVAMGVAIARANRPTRPGADQ